MRFAPWRNRAAEQADNLPGFAELRGGDARVRIVPRMGGRITELALGGRQWLQSPALIPTPVDAVERDDVRFGTEGSPGGIVERFPSAGALRLPTWIGAPFGGLALPDQGELWTHAPDVQIETGRGAHRAICVWPGVRLPYRFERVIEVRADSSVAIGYEIVNVGRVRWPFAWSAAMVMPLDADTRVHLPENASARVAASERLLIAAAAEHRWPYIRIGNRMADFSRPFHVARRFACELSADLSGTSHVVSVVQGATRLDISVDEGVTAIGIGVRRGKVTLDGWRTTEGSELRIEPCISAPGALDEALGAWESAVWLEPGGEYRWSMVLRAGPADAVRNAS